MGYDKKFFLDLFGEFYGYHFSTPGVRVARTAGRSSEAYFAHGKEFNIRRNLSMVPSAGCHVASLRETFIFLLHS